MEKTVKFHILKEKIIKTNELLQLHLDKTKELEKIQKCYQQLKTAVELSKNEIKKLKLKNETLSYNLQLSERNNAPLKDAYDKLKQQYDQLEEESSKTINSLQINYQLTSQELKECKDKLSAFSEQQLPLEVKAKTPVKRKKRVESPIDENADQKVKKLLVENEKLTNENDKLKLEIYELQKKLDNSLDGVNKRKQIESKLKLKEQELLDLKLKLKICEETKMEEISRFSKELKNIELQMDKLKTENERLRNENCSYQIEISMLQESEKLGNLDKIKEQNKMLIHEINKLKDIIHDNNSTPSDEQIDAIMSEIIPPARLSPFSEFNEEMLDSIHNHLPQNTEDMPIIEEKNLPSTVMSLRESHVQSSSGNFMISAYSNYSEIIKATNKKLITKKKNKIIKRKTKKTDLFETLVALKKANIDFLIGNSIIQYDTVSSSFLNNSFSTYIQPNSVVPGRKYPNTVMCTLKCNSLCCKNSHMLLKGGKHENAPLLGFVNVKSESSSHCDIANKSNTIDLVKPIASHRSTKKWKKSQNSYVKSKKKTPKDRANTEVQNEPNVELETEHVPQVPRETCDTKIDSSKKLEDHKKSVISNRKTIRHSYGTRLSRLSHSFADTDACDGLKKKRIACVKQTKSDAVTANCNQKIDDDNGCVLLDNDEDNTSLPLIVNQNAQSRVPIGEDGVKPDQNRVTLASNKIITRQKSPKTVFKRPVCRSRRSQRLVTAQTEIHSNTSEVLFKDVQAIRADDSPPRCPKSPTPENQGCIISRPKIIPLEPTQDKVAKMPTSKIEVLFVKLINYSMEEDVLNEVVGEFSTQDPEYIAQAILEKISQDYHDTPDSKYSPAPLMTVTQRTMLGFMSKLEKSNVVGVFDSYLTLAERKLLTSQVLQEFPPITRLYLAICKLHQDIQRMRKLCCDVFYFCGDFAVPFLFCVLTSWSEVLPHEVNSNDMPLARVLVQIVYMKDCNKPGYNLNPLRDLLIKFYGYPTERWDSNELFQELFHGYLRNPVRSSDFALLLLCKNHPEKWVHEKIEQHLKPIVDKIPSENFKAAVIILIGNLYNRFSSKSENNYLPSIREWLSSLVIETTPDVVKRSVYLCLNRLQKK